MKVLVADRIAQSGLDKLQTEVEVDVITGLTPAELSERISDYEGLIVRSSTQVTAEVIRAGRKLKAIGRAGVGVNNIDVDEATRKGVVVLNVPDGNTIAAAEHTMGLMLALARNIPQAHWALRQGRWERKEHMGVELYGKTLGLIGIGRIGTEVARRARAFGMKILAYDPYASAQKTEKEGIELVGLEELLRESDVISIHTPLNRETKGMIGAEAINKMKDGVRLVNCARGGIIDEEALLRALESGKVAGAALDVFATEPAGDNPLFNLDHVVATPHLGASTFEAQDHNAVTIAEQVLAALKGKPVRNAVNLPSFLPDEWKTAEPYLALAEILGRVYAQAFPGRLKSVEVVYEGEAATLPTGLITNALLKGLLCDILTEEVNLVNAPVVARRRAIKVTESVSHDSHGLSNRVILKAVTENSEREVTGMVRAGDGPCIISVDGYRVDLHPSEFMLLAHHIDKPGIIGQVGTILGQEQVNIAAMQVGRRRLGGEAVMLLLVDEYVQGEILEKINAVDGILHSCQIRLPKHLVGKNETTLLVDEEPEMSA
mgnify:CR=1 FL=1